MSDNHNTHIDRFTFHHPNIDTKNIRDGRLEQAAKHIALIERNTGYEFHSGVTISNEYQGAIGKGGKLFLSEELLFDETVDWDHVQWIIAHEAAHGIFKDIDYTTQLHEAYHSLYNLRGVILDLQRLPGLCLMNLKRDDISIDDFAQNLKHALDYHYRVKQHLSGTIPINEEKAYVKLQGLEMLKAVLANPNMETQIRSLPLPSKTEEKSLNWLNEVCESFVSPLLIKRDEYQPTNEEAQKTLSSLGVVVGQTKITEHLIIENLLLAKEHRCDLFALLFSGLEPEKALEITQAHYSEPHEDGVEHYLEDVLFTHPEFYDRPEVCQMMLTPDQKINTKAALKQGTLSETRSVFESMVKEAFGIS